MQMSKYFKEPNASQDYFDLTIAPKQESIELLGASSQLFFKDPPDNQMADRTAPKGKSQ